MRASLYDQNLWAEADRANEPAEQATSVATSPASAAPHTPLGWVGHNLTQEEWAWLLAVADDRDEAAFQEGSN